MTRSLRFLGIATLLFACSTDSRKPTEEPAPAPRALSLAAPTYETLGDADLRSYWETGASKEAAARFARRDFAGAREAFAGLRLEDPAQSARRDLMVALCDRYLGHHESAAKALDGALTVMPLLANFLRYEAARSYFFAGDKDRAFELARAVDGSSVQGADAELLVGDILRGRGDNEAIYAHYKAYLEARPSGIRRDEARFRLAQAADSMGRQEEAHEHRRVILSSAPLSKWAQKSEEALGNEATLSSAALIERGHVYYQKNRNEKSEADFASALARGDLDAKAQCDASFHRANSVYKQRDRTRAAPLFLQALRSCDGGVDDDLYVKAAYQAGRSFHTLAQYDKALEHYALIESKHGTHSYADDARLLQAEVYEELGDQKNARSFLASMAEKYPEGDMGTEALWRLAWRAYKAQDYQESIGWLQKQIDASPIETHFWAEGQARYWLARAQAKLGKTEESIAAYRLVIRDYPLSYYALLALNRLRETHPKDFAAIREELRASSPTSAKEGALQFRARDEYKSAAFSRVVEFLRLGLPEPATAELHRLGFRSPPGREPLTDEDEIDKAWAVSYLHYSIGNYGQGLWSTRWHLLDFKRHWPTGGWRQRWDIAYPPGYWDLIEKYAGKAGIPTELVMAFVREESGFDPLQESFANAIGLSQLIIPTAKRFAEGTDIEVSRETLRIPENNIRIGTSFMSFLMQKWKGQISLVAPSYNAGENAVARWMKERGEWDRDAFAEEIPYDETRRYSKRVISSYFTYRYLLHDEIPMFPN